MREWMKLWRGSIFVAAFVCAPSVAKAQSSDAQAVAMAQSLVDEASESMDAKQFAKACPKLEQAMRLVPKGIGVKLALAECYVGLGKLASAWGQYVQVETLALAARDSRAKEAATAARKLKPQLAKMTITVPDEMRSVAGLSVTWDGLAQDEGTWGTPIPVDAGPHVIEAKAPGRRPWTHEVKIESNGVSLVEKIPVLEMAPVEAPKPMQTATPAPKEGLQWRTGAILGGMGMSLLGIGAGVGFTLAGSAKHKEAITIADAIAFDRNVNETVCAAGRVDPRCPELRNLESVRDTYGGVAIASFVVGGLAAAGTLAILLTAPKKAQKETSVLIMPSPGGFLLLGKY